jgi:hypothetical protein
LILSESRFGSRLIESRVFVVVLTFSVISGFNATLAPYIPAYLFRIGYSATDYGIISLLQMSLLYLVSPVLYFIVLYVACGGPLLNRIASVLTSIILASLVGHCVGGFLGAVASATLLGASVVFAFLNVTLALLPQYVLQAVLFGFAVLAFSDINIEWTRTLTTEGLQRTRPGGLIYIVILYALFALLNVFAIPFLAVYATSAKVTTLVIAVLAVFSGLVVAGQLILAIGLYQGKKWAWVIALISAGSGILIDVFVMGAMLVFNVFMNVSLFSTGLLVGLLLGFLISIAIFSYLLSIGVRRFFGFVNPVMEAQGRTTEATLHEPVA